MTNNDYNNGHTANDDLTRFTFELEEPIVIKGFSVTYDRKFNTGNFESLNPAITIRVKSLVPAGETFDLHHAKERVRRMARENVRAQLQRLQGNPELVFLGLQPPLNGGPDSVLVHTISVSLTYKVNLGDGNRITPGYMDWADLKRIAHNPSELHMALARLWHSVWANVEDEVSRAQGKGETGGFWGLPGNTVEESALIGRKTPGRQPARGVAIPVMQSASGHVHANNGDRIE